MKLKATIVVISLGLMFWVVLSAQSQEQIERGRYLVEHVSMCGECHTPRDSRGELDRSRWLKGAPIPLESPFKNQQWAFQAPAIGGLPGWNPEDVVEILEKGARRSGKIPRAPMPSFRFKREDAEAIAAYLKSLP